LQREALINRIKNLNRFSSVSDFYNLAHNVYDYQKENNTHYSKWASAFSRNIKTLADIPKLHVSAWKSKIVKTGSFDHDVVFESSGTTGSVTSSHYVKDKEYYLENTVLGFEEVYGSVKNYCILGLLPSYLEREGSSLVAMVDHFIKKSKYEKSGTYLLDHQSLEKVLLSNKSNHIPTVLIGVSFGLLDFIDSYNIEFPELIVMETGGMKGRRAEMSKTRLHEIISAGFGVKKVHSEYGMTELLSQAYSQGSGIYRPSSTMKVIMTEINDPLTQAPFGKAGVISIVDLANIDSCSFISTEDVGIGYEDGTFEIIGRLDQSDIRGCNLMVSDL